MRNTYCFIWFTWQGFGSRKAAGVSSARRIQRLPCAGHSLFQLAPANPLLAKAEPSSQASDPSQKTFLRVEYQDSRAEQGEQVINSPVDTKLRDRAGAAPGNGTDIPPSLLRGTCWSRQPHSVHGGPHTRTSGCFLKETTAYRDPTC